MKPKLQFFFALLIVAVLLLISCSGPSQPETYTIGVVNYVPVLENIIDGFKAGMTELGYVEGENVTYIYHGLLENDPDVIAAEVQALIDENVDLLFTLGTPTTLAAKTAVEGTDLPVIFAPVVDPVGQGAVASLSQPGGNLTGVQSVNAAPKALEWLTKLVPNTKQVYLFYNPIDGVSVGFVNILPETATQLGVEFIPTEVDSVEAELAIIQTLPEDAAILFVPTPSLASGLNDVKTLAMQLGIPMGEYNDSGENNVIFGFTVDRGGQGKQAARLADKVFTGTNPGEIPVETAETFLIINLKTAQALGLNIPENLLQLANEVIQE